MTVISGFEGQGFVIEATVLPKEEKIKYEEGVKGEKCRGISGPRWGRKPSHWRVGVSRGDCGLPDWLPANPHNELFPIDEVGLKKNHAVMFKV